MSTVNPKLYPYDCTGDICVGDVVLFSEAVFIGSHRRPKYQGDRRIVARVVRDSYGPTTHQHTFTLEVVDSDGTSPLIPGARVRRKGRNVYKNGTRRMPWEDEKSRQEALDEKHARGDAARLARAANRAY